MHLNVATTARVWLQVKSHPDEKVTGANALPVPIPLYGGEQHESEPAEASTNGVKVNGTDSACAALVLKNVSCTQDKAEFVPLATVLELLLHEPKKFCGEPFSK